MTRDEAIKILSILKAAYPNSYRGMTKDEANGTINIWSMQFGNMPYEVVLIAVNKLISTNQFPPSINEVKTKLKALYSEANCMILSHNQAVKNGEFAGKKLDDQTITTLELIMKYTESYYYGRLEPSIADLSVSLNISLEMQNNMALLGE